MAINKVVFGNDTLIDITDTTALASDVSIGKYFYLANGEKVQGTAVLGGMTVVETEDQYGGTIVEISGDPVKLQAKTATPSSTSQTISPDDTYTGLSEVVVEAIPSQYIIPAGSTNITSNGTVDVTAYASAVVNVQPTLNLQSKTVTPDESEMVVAADTGYTALSSVTVEAISSNYVGSNIGRKSSSDLSVSGAVVSVPSGYYAAAASTTIGSGSATTPATMITKNPTITVSAAGLITASYESSKSITPTVVAGYVSAGTAGTVTASGSATSQLTTKAAATISPTESEQTAVASGVYTTGVIKIGAVSSNYVGSNIATHSSADLAASGSTITAPAGYYAAAAAKSVSAGSATTPATTISVTPGISVNTSTGVITATAAASSYVTPTVSAGYVSAGTSGKITVSGSNTSSLTTQAAKTVTPTKSSQTAVAANRYTTGAVTVAAIPAAYQDVTGVTASASDVLSGKAIVDSSGTVVNGSLVIQHYYTGSGTPTAATGSNGDIYLKTS